MLTSTRRFAVVALSLCAVAARAAPDPVAVYSFQNTLASSVAGAPALTATDPLGMSGFGTDTVFGQSATVYNFQGLASPVLSQAGLSLNVASLLAGHADSYSLEIVFKFTERANAWRRIVDVQNRQSDNGFYVDPGNSLDIFPVASGGGFTNNVYHDVFLVNDRGTATFYLDGGPATLVSTAVMNIDSTNSIGFFLDNVAGGGQGEYSSGSVALIRLYASALSAPPPPPLPVPEPTSAALMLAGLAAMAGLARRRGGVKPA